MFYSNSIYINQLINYNLYGLSWNFKNLIIKRFELTTFNYTFSKNIFFLQYLKYSYRNLVKTINILFSQINNVNSNLLELKKTNILHKYLIKSYQGYCHFIGKPVRGQRTWSNSWNAFKSNNILRSIINKIKHSNLNKNKNIPLKKDYKKIKKKYSEHFKKNNFFKKSLVKNKRTSTSWF